MQTSKRPQQDDGLFESACLTNKSALSGSCVSACRNNNTVPVARAAPAFICRARPQAALSTVKPARSTISAELSSLPPSTRIISQLFRTSGVSLSSNLGILCASFSIGMIMDNFIIFRAILFVIVSKRGNEITRSTNVAAYEFFSIYPRRIYLLLPK